MENFQFENPVSGYGQHLNREEAAQKEQSAGAGVYDAFKLSQNLRAERNSNENIIKS